MFRLKNLLSATRNKRLFILAVILCLFLFLPVISQASQLCINTDSDSVLFSVDETTTLPKIGDVGPEDIIALNLETDTFQIIFDGSDVGVQTNINAFTIIHSSRILISFEKETSLPEIGMVSENDVVQFSPSTLGEDTSGTFFLYLDGSDVDLNEASENIDALHYLNDGSLVLSTSGDLSVSDLNGSETTLLQFTFETKGEETKGTWQIYSDAVDSDINGLHLDETIGTLPDMYLAKNQNIQRDAELPLSGKIDVFFPSELGERSQGSFGQTGFLKRSEQLLGKTSIDGLSMVRAQIIEALEPKPFYDLWQKNLTDPNYILMDIRTPKEFQKERLKGAVLLDYYSPTFAKELAALDRKKAYLLYCRTGNRTGKALEQMRKLGFVEAYHLVGGINKWKNPNNLPTVIPPLSAFTYSPKSGKASLLVSFDASQSKDPKGNTLSYEWDFGDNTTGNKVAPKHTYTNIGKYAVTLFVTNTEGAKSKSTQYVIVADGKTPGSPVSLSASPGSNRVTLSWSDNKEFDVIKYRIYRSSNSGSNYKRIGASKISQFSDTSAISGTTYYYVVTAVDAINLESGYSRELSATPEDSATTVLFSLNKAETLNGLGSVGKEDIVSLDLTTGKFSMVFDGSSIGITNDINALHQMDNGDILISYAKTTNIPGLGNVQNRDIVKFIPTSLGTTTQGKFEMFFDGSDVDLDKNSENIDAIYYMSDGGIIFSTTGAFGCG